MLYSVFENVRSAGKGLLPLVVGVTGHRDLAPDDDSETTARVRDFLCRLQATYPHTPIVLLSSLAEGADRLVAEAALESGAELYVVLPMKAEVYEQDFASAKSVEQFHRLLARSSGALIVGAPEADRNHAYAAAGAFVVSHSEILIALWDGNEDEMRGGTSQIVRFALRGVPADYLSRSREALRSNETGAVYHIPVRRQSSTPKPEAQPAWRYPETDSNDRAALSAARAAFEENLRNLERFNRDAVASAKGSFRARDSALLLPPEREASLAAPGAVQYTRTLFAQADALALRCRNWTHRATIGIFGTVALATLLFALYTNIMTDRATLYFAFLASVALAFGIDLAVVRKRMQDRFQDYRALAEGLRVQYYWRLAGIRESVYDHYFARQEGELDWIRNAMRAEAFRPQGAVVAGPGDGQTRALLETVLAQWIQGEEAYFSKAFRCERVIATRIRWSANVCLVAATVVALLLAATVARNQFPYHGFLVAALTLTLAGAGLMTGYAQKRAHAEHARRYRRMVALYRVASDRLAILLRRGDLNAARGVLIQLGREALAENCDWLLLHRERQIDVPTA